MLFFEWQRIDWIKWMPIEVTVLLGLIVLIRFLRWIFRWGPVSSSHLQKDRYQIDEFILYKYQKKHDIGVATSSSQNIVKNSVLFIPPLSVGFRGFDHLAGAIALAGYSVIVLSASNIQKIWKNQVGDTFLHKCCEDNTITHIIVCDYAAPLITKGLQHYKHPITWIYIRPTFSWTNIKPFWQLILSPTLFFSKLLLRIRFLSKYLQFSTFNVLQLLSLKNDHGIFILPSKSWMTTASIEEMDEWGKMSTHYDQFQIIRINKGGWSFFRNETIVFGYILRILRDL